MDIELKNMGPGRVFPATGVDIRIDIVDRGTASVRAVLTIDEVTHIHYPSKGGKATLSRRTLAKGVHSCAVVAVAHDTAGGRAYDLVLSINGTVAATARGTLAAGIADETAFKIFQLNVT